MTSVLFFEVAAFHRADPS